jgi:hypothetical protein
MAAKIHKLGESVCLLRSWARIAVLSLTDDVILKPKDDSALLLIGHAAKSSSHLSD